jgi:prevent-host-death family protein
MKQWTLEQAKNGFSEVVRRALQHQPQLVTRGRRGEEAVVILARDEYERLVAPRNLADVLRDSPLAEAFAAGDPQTSAGLDPFGRVRELSRDVEL